MILVQLYVQDIFRVKRAVSTLYWILRNHEEDFTSIACCLNDACSHLYRTRII